MCILIDSSLKDVMFSCIHVPLTIMQSANATTRTVLKRMKELKLNCLLSFHLLHPEMDDKVHSSRRMFPQSLDGFGMVLDGFRMGYWIGLADLKTWFVSGFPDATAPQFLLSPSGNLGQAENVLHAISSTEDLKFKSKFYMTTPNSKNKTLTSVVSLQIFPSKPIIMLWWKCIEIYLRSLNFEGVMRMIFIIFFKYVLK